MGRLIYFCGIYLVLSIVQESFGYTYSNPEPVVNIPLVGSVRGTSGLSAWTQQPYYKFLGIPFGETTGGPNRFQLPRPKYGWTDIFNATEEKLPCPRMNLTEYLYLSDMEDCLHLSIYTKDVRGRHPVIVILNGEMFYESNVDNQRPDYFMTKDVVLVVPQFRTGILGFLSTGTSSIPGNAGIFDAKLALDWVQANIQYFGGDPRRVTLIGQSGGAVIAHALSISPLIQHDSLFQQLILQSGTALSPNVIRKNPINYARILGEILDCPHRNSPNELSICLIQTPLSKLYESVIVAITRRIPEMPDNIGVKLTIRDYNGLLPDIPYNLVNADNPKYPMIAGVTKNDGMFAFDDEYVLMSTLNFDEKMTMNSFLQGFISRLGVNDNSGALRGFIRIKLLPQYHLTEGNFFKLIPDFVDLAGIITLKTPIWTTVEFNYHSNPHHTYLYSFDYKGQYTRFGYGDDKSFSPYYGGVCHNDENIYLFPLRNYELNESDLLIARNMIDLWTSFARDGIPSSPNVPEWKPVSNLKGPYMKIDYYSNIGENFFDEFFITSHDEHAGKSILREENRHLITIGNESV